MHTVIERRFKTQVVYRGQKKPNYKTLVFIEDKKEKTAIFKLSAVPTEYEMGDVNRMQFFNIEYTFKDLGKGRVRITIEGNSSPPVKVPMWLVKSAFPKAPASTVKKIIKLVH